MDNKLAEVERVIRETWNRYDPLLAKAQLEHLVTGALPVISRLLDAAHKEAVDALALINKHLVGRKYTDLDDALRNLLQAYISMKGNEDEVRDAAHADALRAAADIALAEPRIWDTFAPDPQHRIAGQILALVPERARLLREAHDAELAERVRREALEEAAQHPQHNIFSVHRGAVVQSSCACGAPFPTQGSCEAWQNHVRSL